MTFAPIQLCRSCGNGSLFPVLDLGEQPLANSYRAIDDTSDEPRFPLALVGCPTCSLVQLNGTVPPPMMFDNYHYFSSYSTTMVERMRVLAQRVVADRNLTEKDLVVEVASNDGYLLQHYRAAGINVLGIEPAANVAEVARAAGIPTVVEYFGREVAERLHQDHGAAKVMHANNVMAHVPDINDFIAGFAALLDDGGVAIVESPYLVDFIEHCEFDTTYHEHVFYYSLTAIDALVRRHGLVVADVEALDIHGGTLRCFLRHEGADVSPGVQEILRHEAALGVASTEYYAAFASRVEDLSQRLRDQLLGLKAEGRRIAAYGAAAKGTVLLNHIGVGSDVLDFVVDRNPHKQGLAMPGVGLAIHDPAALLTERPDYVLLLAWNFAEEILQQQRAYLDQGGHFIVPLPELRVI